MMLINKTFFWGVFQVRQDIEECSREKRELERIYKSTFDGKERMEIAERKEFTLVKLRRLQAELQDLISK